MFDHDASWNQQRTETDLDMYIKIYYVYMYIYCTRYILCKLIYNIYHIYNIYIYIHIQYIYIQYIYTIYIYTQYIYIYTIYDICLAMKHIYIYIYMYVYIYMYNFSSHTQICAYYITISKLALHNVILWYGEYHQQWDLCLPRWRIFCTTGVGATLFTDHSLIWRIL